MQSKTQPLTLTPLLSHRDGPSVPISNPNPGEPQHREAAESHQAQLAWFEPWGRAAPWGQHNRKAGPPATYPIASLPPLATAAGCSDTCHRLHQYSLFLLKLSVIVWPSSFLLQTRLQWIQFQLHLSIEICLACLILLYLTSDFSVFQQDLPEKNAACLFSFLCFSVLWVLGFFKPCIQRRKIWGNCGLLTQTSYGKLFFILFPSWQLTGHFIILFLLYKRVGSWLKLSIKFSSSFERCLSSQY